MEFHLCVSENNTYRPENGKKAVPSSFLLPCVAIVRKYPRVPEQIYMKDAVYPLKMAKKFSISEGSQLCFV